MSGAGATSGASDLGTVGAALAAVAEMLARSGVPSPRREARLLVALALDAGIEQVIGYPERSLTPAQRGRLDKIVTRRAAREPLSRILGEREFWGLRFQLSPATLDPRPDSETLVEAVLAALPDRAASLSILDLGTGTGCLLLALLSELPAARGVGVDSAEEALRTAVANAEALGLAGRARFVAGSWCAALEGRWNVVVGNPPYIAEADLAGLEPEVTGHDPRAALAAGVDGLDAYGAILPALPPLLAPGGFAVLEIGAGQANSVIALARNAGLSLRSRHRDLGGVERCVMLETGA